MPAESRFPEHGPLLCGLAVTSVTGWGSIYYTPSVLAGYLDRDLGLSGTVVFGGITLLLITGAICAPMIGRHVDRRGTRRSMWVGSLVCALGLALLSAVQGPVSYLACWVVLGIGHALAFANVGNVTVAQLMGERTRRVIGIMMLATGLASSVFWPLTSVLAEAFGWRATLLIYAAMQVVIVLPIHLMIPVYRGTPPAASSPAARHEEEGRVVPQQRRVAFWLVAILFSGSGLVSWGLPVHLIGMFQDAGLSRESAVWIATLTGPATMVARLVDVMIGGRIAAERIAFAGLVLGPLSCLILAISPGSTFGAVAFVLIFSAAMGVISVARATLPLTLFGRRGFATMLGRLTVPQNLAFSASPLLFALLIGRLGNSATLVISAAIQMIALVAMLLLMGRLRSGGGQTPSSP